MGLHEFDDYRDYLRDYLKHLPRKGRGELSRWAAQLNTNSTLVSQVMAGTRELSMDQAYRLSQHLGLNSEETEFFLLLVQHSRAGTGEFRNHLKSRIEQRRKEALKIAKHVTTEGELSETEKAQFYSSWIYSAVHLFTSMSSVSAHEIATRFGLTLEQTHDIVHFLNEIGLIQPENHRWKIAQKSTFVPFGSLHLNNHHRNWRIKWLNDLDRIRQEDLMFTGQVSLSRKDFTRLRKMAVEFIASVSQVVESSPAEELACFHLDWIRLP